MTKVFVLDGLRKAGAQVVTVDLCNFLATKGENITVVTFRSYEDLQLAPSINHVTLNIFGLSRARAVDNAERILYRILGKIWCLVYSIYCSYRLKQAIKPLDQVKEVFLISDAAFSWFFRIKKFYKTTIVFHSVKSIQYASHPVNRRMGPWFLRKCTDNCSLIAISARIKADLVRYGEVSETQIRLAQNFVDHEKVQSLSKCKPELTVNEYYFIYVGRLSTEKRPLEMLRAYSDFVAQTNNPPKLYIVGEGPLENRIKNLVDELSLGNKVVLTGKLQNPYPLIKAAAVLVLNSEREGFPTVILEAAILGIPFVSSRSFDELDDIACEPNEHSTFDVGDHAGLVASLRAAHAGKISPNFELRRTSKDAADAY